LFQTVEKIS